MRVYTSPLPIKVSTAIPAMEQANRDRNDSTFELGGLDCRAEQEAVATVGFTEVLERMLFGRD